MSFEPWKIRDIFILSKAHAALALYCTLYQKGMISRETLDGFYQDQGTLSAHLDRNCAKGVEISAGSLGHGFNMGIGIALGLKRQWSNRKVFILIGDGESQEGSIWEGALFAPHFKLNNLTVILDFNNLQGYGRSTEICSFEPVAEKWRAFGWETYEVDGHNLVALSEVLEEPHQKPKIIIARTTKGKGVSFMEDQLIWHYYIVTDEIKKRALDELR